jgi:hypothetical protein
MTPPYDVETPSGPGRVTEDPPTAGRSRGLVVVGHGAGGGIAAPDIVAVTRALTADGWTVARVEQPYRVAGRRMPEPAPKLDAAWVATVTEVRRRHPRGRLVLAGRSSGARVACRCAVPLHADAVVALAFPLHPPGRPEKSRLPELLAAGVPVLVLQGERDPFGSRAEFPDDANVVSVPGDHSLRPGVATAAAAAREWLAGLPGGNPRSRTGV